jgi:hypothetical protein
MFVSEILEDVLKNFRLLEVRQVTEAIDAGKKTKGATTTLAQPYVYQPSRQLPAGDVVPEKAGESSGKT